MQADRRTLLTGLAAMPATVAAIATSTATSTAGHADTAAGAGAEPPIPALARTEAIPFATQTMSDPEFLSGASGKDATIAGVLRVPATGAGKSPLAILLHGSGGALAYVDAWALRLHQWGWASFVVDSFSGRGLSSVRDDQGALGRLAGCLDAYRALERLADHPLIDPTRIVLMGFSRGGQGALYAAVQRFQQMHLRGKGRFAGHISFYPNCCTRYIGDDEVASAPIRVHHGEADDFNPFAASSSYVARLRARGHDATLSAYPGAYHVFDWSGFAKPIIAPDAQSMRNCQIVETAPGVLNNAVTGQTFTYADACVVRGTTVAYNESAAKAAIGAVGETLARWRG